MRKTKNGGGFGLSEVDFEHFSKEMFPKIAGKSPDICLKKDCSLSMKAKRKRNPRWARNLGHTFYFVLALLTLIAGAILLPLPIPLGIPLIALSLALMLRSFPAVRRWVRRRASGIPILEKALSYLSPSTR